MGETRDRGILASRESIQKLKAAQAGRRNTDGRIWTLRDIAIESGIEERTVGRLFRREARVDEKTARSICEVLGVSYEEVIDFQSSEIEEDRIGQIGSNPFIYGDPVPPEKFYGRRSAVLDVKNRIGAVTAQSINIVGFRRIGKTSLLRYIQGRPAEFIAAERKPMIVSLDLQDRGRFSSPSGVIEGLRRGIMREQRGRVPWSQEENDDPWAVQDGLEVLRDSGVRLIVMLDEFEAIASERFYGWGEDWRSKASTQGLFSLVVASNRPISEIYQGLGLTSPFGNIFSTTVLGGLEQDAWQKLIRDGFAGSEVSKATMDRIEALAGGLPFYVQMASALLWQEGDLRQAEEAFRIQVKPRLRELWQNLSENEQNALQQSINEDKATVENLQRYGVIQDEDRLFSIVFTELVQGKNELGNR
jgi:transcriptional regulator with XRE-family HTH domain